MILRPKRKIRLETERLLLRPPQHGDYRMWSDVRRVSQQFLAPWEPVWSPDHLTRKTFTNRVYWAERSIANETALPLFLFQQQSGQLIGGITLDHIRRGPSQAATAGYWMGEPFARHGYMREAIQAVVGYAFSALDLSRIEAGCLPENQPSRSLLEKCGFKYEGVAQSYLQINGRWRTHVLYANLRHDRRGKTDAG